MSYQHRIIDPKHYFVIPEIARILGIFGPHLDWVGPYSTPKVTESAYNALVVKCESMAALPHPSEVQDTTTTNQT